MVCYSHLFQDFPQFIVIYTVKGLGVVNKAEIDVFLELSCFIDYAKAFDCVDHTKLWKILKEMGIADHLICLLRICVQVRKQQLELDMEQQTGSK